MNPQEDALGDSQRDVRAFARAQRPQLALQNARLGAKELPDFVIRPPPQLSDQRCGVVPLEGQRHTGTGANLVFKDGCHNGIMD